jgi:hypothetical protein
MASLTVLSTVGAIPMGNMNLFSDAIASGKHSDRYDNSQEYEKSYYSDNENNYRANYDDYYYKQQQPSYNNNHGYEDNKKISYDNSYDNDNSKYSNYPTKDKKYVCQTGQFEGFFVESVEFCLSHNKPPAPPTPVNNNSSIVNSFTCVNPNIININTDTNRSSSSLSELQPMLSAAAKGLNGNLDRHDQIDLNKAIVNLCIINDNDKIVIEDEAQPEPPTCEDCFTKVLTDKELDDLIQAIEELSGGEVSSLEEFCDFIDDSSGIEDGPAFISQVLFELGEEVGISDSDDKINEILDCLEEVFNVDFPREIIV